MWEYNYTPEPDELMHYGVLGMKWGVRRAKKNADRERRISRKVSKLEYKADLARLKKKGQLGDKEKLYKAKAKKLANDEQIEQEHDDDMEAVAKKERGRKITMALIGTAVAGVTIAAIAVHNKNKGSGDSVIETATAAATSGSSTTVPGVAATTARGRSATSRALSRAARTETRAAKASAKAAARAEKTRVKAAAKIAKDKKYAEKVVNYFNYHGEVPFGAIWRKGWNTRDIPALTAFIGR